MKDLDIKVTKVFDKNYESFNNPKIRFIINQGGSRSSKTYSLCQMLIVYCLTNPGKLVSIIRKTFPSLRGSVMRDFFEVLNELELYNQSEHHKTENMYNFSNGSSVEFFAADDEQKLRGRKRDICWVNESNELSLEEFTQLNMRTSSKLIFDFNPSENFHWLYDLVSREESVLIKSTYKDNPFLEDSLIKEIEGLIKYDESYYKIYALGERGTGKSTIYTHWKYYENKPDVKETIYGLDFGYNHPTAMIECNFVDNSVYVKEVIYNINLTSSDLVERLNNLNINKNREMICDSARPEIIEDLRRSGYNAKQAIKNVKEGIDSVKSIDLYIHKESLNIVKEISAYKWKSNGDVLIDEPVKVYDDGMDAMRYSIHWYKSRNKKSNPNLFRIRY